MSLFDKMLTNNYSIFDEEIDKNTKSKKRKSPTNQKQNNNQSKRKKVNEDHENIDNEITSKTSYTYNNTTSKSDPITSNTIFKSENESFFISNDDLFERYMEKEKEKFKENNKNKNYHQNFKNDIDDSTQLLTNELLELFCNDNCYELEDNHQNSSSSSSSESLLHHHHKSYNVDEFYCDENSYDENDNENDECFLCSWGNSAHDGIYSQHLQKLRDIYIKNRAYVQDEALALMLHLYFRENVWDPRVKGMPMLTYTNALMHIKNFGKTHTLNASEHVIESIRFWSKVHQNISKSLFRQDEKIDKDQFNCLKETQKLLDGFYAKDINKLNFKDPDMRIDTTGSLFKIKTFNTNDEKIIKNKKITQDNIKKNRTIDIH